MQKENSFFGLENNFLSPINSFNKLENEEKKEKLFLGKKIQSDTDLILWLSGKEINQKNESEKTVPSELNSKVKRKLRNKLIKNAKKCELYFLSHFSNKEYIINTCLYCLKNFFDHNELLRFTNFEDFVYYLKYIFYLSDEVFSYSLINFKKNKKDIDNLFSKYESKEENWKFDQDKIMCKLCMLKLVNKPNFVENVKKIFFEKKCELGIKDEDELIIELDNNNNNKQNCQQNQEMIKKKGNNKVNQNKSNNNNKYYNSDIPNKINIYNSNNINININNEHIINNNYNNTDELLYYKFKFYDLIEKINNNPKSEEINLYYKQLFFITHNIIVEVCIKIKHELEKLIINIQYLNIQKSGESEKDTHISLQKSQNDIFILLNEILKLMVITNKCLFIYQNEYSKIDINIFQALNYLINLNEFNFSNIEKNIGIFLLGYKLYNSA